MSKKLKSRQSDQRTYDPDITYAEDLTQSNDYNPWEEDENGEPIVYWDNINESSITDLGGKGVRNRNQAKRLAREDFVNGVQDRKVRYVGSPRTSYGVQQPGDKYPSYEVKDMTPVMQKAYDKAYNKAKVQWLDQEEKKQHNLDLLNTIRKGGAEGTAALQDWTREHTNEDAEYMANRLGWLPGAQWMFIPSVFNSIGQMRSNGMTGPGWTALQAGMGLASVLPVGELFSGAASRWGSAVGGKLGTLARLENQSNKFIDGFNFNKSLYKAMGNTPLARSSARLMAKSDVQLATEVLNSANKELNGLATKYNLASVARNTLSEDAQKAIADAESRVRWAQQSLNEALAEQTRAGTLFPKPRKTSPLWQKNYRIERLQAENTSPYWMTPATRAKAKADDFQKHLSAQILIAQDRYEKALAVWTERAKKMLAQNKRLAENGGYDWREVKNGYAVSPFLKGDGVGPYLVSPEYKRIGLYRSYGLERKPQPDDYFVSIGGLRNIPLSKFTETAYNKGIARGVHGLQLSDYGLYFGKDGKLYYNPFHNVEHTFAPGVTEIPVFGTWNEGTHTFEKVPVSVKLSATVNGENIGPGIPISELSAASEPTTVDILLSETGYVSPELKGIIEHNVAFLRNELGGGDPIGTILSAGDVPNLPHDMDWIVTDKMLAQRGIQIFDQNDRDMFVYHVGGEPNGPSPYGNFGDVQVNVIRTGADGKAEGYIAEELFRQFYPEEYSKALLEAWNNNSHTPKIPYTPEQLMETYEDNMMAKQIVDVLESEKPKHIRRVYGYLVHGDPDQMSKGIELFQRSLVGDDFIHAPKFAFNNPEENLALLREMNIPYDISNDPKRMQNAFDLWFYEVTRNYRGISDEALGDRDKIIKWLNTGSGKLDYCGIWSVLRGHSHFGPMARRKQILIPGVEHAKSPQEVMALVKHATGQFPLTDQECAIMGNPKLKPGMNAKEILHLMTSIDTSNEIYSDLQKVGIQGFALENYVTGTLFRAGDYLQGPALFTESRIDPPTLLQRVQSLTPSAANNIFNKYDYAVGDYVLDSYGRWTPLEPRKLFRYGNSSVEATWKNKGMKMEETAQKLLDKENAIRDFRTKVLDKQLEQVKRAMAVRNTLGKLSSVGQSVGIGGGMLGGLYGLGAGVVGTSRMSQYNYFKERYGITKEDLQKMLSNYKEENPHDNSDFDTFLNRIYRRARLEEDLFNLRDWGYRTELDSKKSGGTLVYRYGFPILR